MSLIERLEDDRAPREFESSATTQELYAEILRLRKEVENLKLALNTNREIAAATGVLMATQRLDQGQAFELLRLASQRSHRKLRELAVEVLFSGALPDDDPGPARSVVGQSQLGQFQ